MAKQRRRDLLRDLLRSGPIASQDDLVAALCADGEVVTQATISRDLAAVGAVKGPDGYFLSADSNGVSPRDDGDQAASIRRYAVSVAAADSLVVIRTGPGHAGLIAVELDRRLPRGVVGTLAGDDTIFLATTGRSVAARLVKELRAQMRSSGARAGGAS